MHFTSKVGRVLSEPEMLLMFARWQSAQVLGLPPRFNVHGAALTGFPNFSSYWGAWCNRPTLGEVSLIRRAASQGGTILDIGGNFGAFCILFAQANAEATVHAFEPVSRTYQALKHNVEKSGAANVQVRQIAMADRVGEMDMTATADPATNRLLQAPESSQATERVATTTIDAFCEGNGIKFLNFMKVDVEGAEPLVLAGASRMLARRAIKGALIEICPRNLANFGYAVADLASPFENAGYRLFELEPDGCAGRSPTLSDLERIALTNVLALPV